MNKEFVIYEQSLELKNLGFDEMCLSYYKDDEFSGGLEEVRNSTMSDDYKVTYIAAPLKQQVFRWFREKYDLHVMLGLHDLCNNDTYRFSIWERDDLVYNQDVGKKPYYKTYEEAENACIDKLIEIIKK